MVYVKELFGVKFLIEIFSHPHLLLSTDHLSYCILDGRRFAEISV